MEIEPHNLDDASKEDHFQKPIITRRNFLRLASATAFTILAGQWVLRFINNDLASKPYPKPTQPTPSDSPLKTPNNSPKDLKQ